MTTLLSEFELDGLQIRAASAVDFKVEEGEIEGRAVPYGVEAELLPGLRERFEMGAFAAQVRDPARIKIAASHGEVIGHCTHLEERTDGLWMRAKIVMDDAVPEARKQLALLKHKVIDELSVGFQTLSGGFETVEDRKGTLVIHKRARLREISVVPFGAYGRGARVMAVREERAAADEARWKQEWLAKINALGGPK